MVRVYCRAHHGGEQTCEDCTALLRYAHFRLERCPFGEGKPTCAQCPVHCYKPEPREKVRQVMRFSGPRMLWRHPILTLLHFWDAWVHRVPKPVPPAKPALPSPEGRGNSRTQRTYRALP